MIESRGPVASLPRQTPLTGRRKGTARFCGPCTEAGGASVWHSLFPAEACPREAPRPEPGSVPLIPAIRKAKPGQRRVRFDPASAGV